MPAKSSKEVKSGDEIEIKRKNRMTRVLVLQIPDKKQMSKAGAETLYKVIADETLDEPDTLA